MVNYNRFNGTNLVAGQNHWQFDAAHRGTVGFQSASLRQQFGSPKNFEEKNFQGTRGTLQGNRSSRAEEWREAEPGADDDPEVPTARPRDEQ